MGDLASMKKFAEENLGPTCGPENIDLCNDDDKATIERCQAMNLDELNKQVEEADAKIAKIEEKAGKAVDKLEKGISDVNAKIKKENDNKDAEIEKETKKFGLKFKRSVA